MFNGFEFQGLGPIGIQGLELPPKVVHVTLLWPGPRPFLVAKTRFNTEKATSVPLSSISLGLNTRGRMELIDGADEVTMIYLAHKAFSKAIFNSPFCGTGI